MLLWIAIALVGATAVLSVPVDVRFSVNRHAARGAEVSVLWLFGLIRVGRLRRPRGARKAKRKSKKKKRAARSWIAGWRSASAALTTTGFPLRAFRFVAAMLRSLRVRAVSTHMRLGLPDPADTGMLWTVLGPVSGLLMAVPNATVVVEPDFSTTCFELDGEGQVRVLPIRVLPIIGCFAFSPVTLRAAWAARRARRTCKS